MNRFICQIINNKINVVTLTSGEPKDSFVNFIFKYVENKKVPKTKIKNNITIKNNNYYYDNYFISR